MDFHYTPCDQISNNPLVTIYDDTKIHKQGSILFFGLDWSFWILKSLPEYKIQKPRKLLRRYNFFVYRMIFPAL